MENILLFETTTHNINFDNITYKLLSTNACYIWNNNLSEQEKHKIYDYFANEVGIGDAHGQTRDYAFWKRWINNYIINYKETDND
jgi:hypothetical protein